MQSRITIAYRDRDTRLDSEGKEKEERQRSETLESARKRTRQLRGDDHHVTSIANSTTTVRDSRRCDSVDACLLTMYIHVTCQSPTDFFASGRPTVDIEIGMGGIERAWKGDEEKDVERQEVTEKKTEGGREAAEVALGGSSSSGFAKLGCEYSN